MVMNMKQMKNTSKRTDEDIKDDGGSDEDGWHY